jgi:hypothetical protein
LGRFTLALEIHAGGFAELRIQSAARWYVAHRRHSRGAEARRRCERAMAPWHHAGCGQLGDAQQRWALYRYQGAAEQGYVPALLLTAYFSLAQPDLVHDEHSRTLAKLQAGEKLLLVSPNEERFLTTTFGGTAYQKRVQSMRRKLNASQPEVESAHPHGPVVPSLAALEAHLAGR